MTPPPPTRERTAIWLCTLTTLAAFVVTSTLSRFSLEQVLVAAIGISLALWVGGAVSGQILLARALDIAPPAHVTIYLRQLLWIIPRVYVPLGVVAVGAGLYLVAQQPSAWADPAVIIPLALYVVTAIAGSAISAPGYIRIVRQLKRDEDIALEDNRRRLVVLAWVNRTELVLVVGVALPLLAGLA